MSNLPRSHRVDPATRGRHRHQRQNFHSKATAAGLAAGLIFVAGISWRASTAAYSATTANPGNSLTTGTIALSDSQSGTAVFNLTSMLPGDRYYRCVTVTYTGNVLPTAPVKLYATSTSGSLSSYFKLTVEEGSGSTSLACANFVSASTIFNATTPVASTGRLAAFTAAYTSYGTGIGSWQPSATGQSRSYRFMIDLVGDNAGQSTTIQTTVTWTATS